MAEEQILNLPFKLFFLNASTGLVLADLRGKILIANPAFAKLFGHNIQDISHRDFLSFVPGDKVKDVNNMLDGAVMGAPQHCHKETPFLCQDGKSLSVMLSAALVQDAMEKPLCIMITLAEITAYQDRRNNRKPLLAPAIAGDGQRRQMLGSVDHPLILVNEARRIEGINLHCEKSFGFLLQELLNQPIGYLLPEFDRQWPIQSHASPALIGSNSAKPVFATHALHKDGRRLPVSLDLTPINMGDRRLWMGIIQNLSEHKAEQESALSLAWCDSVTGQNNRPLFQERLRHAIRRTEREGKKLGVLFLNLDQFKRLNDSFGYEAGDQLLKDAGARIADSVRKSDTVARYSGDRYTILLEGLDMAEHISSVAQKLIGRFGAPFQWRGQDVYVTASIGISVYPVDGIDGDSLIKNAESAMHQAKNDGGNAFQFYTQELNTRAVERMKLDSDLHRALKQCEFVIHYQPVVNIANTGVSCLEALVRWHHPEKGVQPPLSFIPFLEETGLIVPVGDWILRTACRQIKALRTNGYSDLRMAVNISGRQLLQKDFAQSLGDILQETGLDPRALELEITESVLIRDTEGSAKMLSSLVERGVSIALDDFGTGYSPLSYLKRFPIHTIKIDRNFIQGVPKKRNDVAITNAILGLAANLGMNVIAEGVETEEQLKFLRERDCHELQGFLFSKPMPAGELSHWLHNRAH